MTSRTKRFSASTPRTAGLLVVAAACAAVAAGCVGEIGGGGSDGKNGLDNHPQIGPDGRYICDSGPYPAVTSARRLSSTEYQNVVHDVFGPSVAASTKYPSSYGKSGTGYSTEPALYDVGQQGVESLMIASEDVAEAVAPILPSLLPCASAADAGVPCATQYVDSVVRRAYRRPVADDERAALLATYQGGRDSGASFTESVAMMTAHALQSPQFLYVTEAAAPGGRQLDGYEIASRLSFYLWETIPDEALLAKAANGELESPDTRRAEARRMLADPRSDAVLRRFFREWTQTTDVTPGNKDPNAVPGFDDAYAQSMASSFDRFTTDQAHNGTLQSLLTSQSVWVDDKMAGFFGVAAPQSGWTQVTLEGGASGLATQPLLLASAAHYSDSSYVFRGRFVRKRLLCDNLGAPPGDAQATFDAIPKPDNPTGKDLSASVNSMPACAGCHTQMDPAGLSFEGFGALGERRATYASGKSIDPSGTITVDGVGDITFSSYQDLLAQLSDKPVVAQCFGRQIVRFAMSRQDTVDDACAAQAIGDFVAAGKGSLADGIVEMAVSDSFGYRRD